jgi:hypothetical protein
MYVNYYDRFEKQDFENPTIGILLCTDKNDAVVKITLPENNNTKNQCWGCKCSSPPTHLEHTHIHCMQFHCNQKHMSSTNMWPHCIL